MRSIKIHWTLGLAATMLLVMTGASAQNSAQRNLPDCYTPGAAITVSITTTVQSAANSHIVTDNLPSGWTASSPNEGGVVSPGKVRWAVQRPGGATLTYRATPPAGASGAANFNGTMLPGVSPPPTITIAGESSISNCSTPGCFTLTVNSGSASTSRNCTGGYTNGTNVTITAKTADQGQVFDRWTGSAVASATSSTTTITMNANKTVTATYRNVGGGNSVGINRTVNYKNCWERRGTVTLPGVTQLRLVIEILDIETCCDSLRVVNSYNTEGRYTTPYTSGDNVELLMSSDSSVGGSFRIVSAEYTGTPTGSPRLSGSLFTGSSTSDCPIDPCTGCGCAKGLPLIKYAETYSPEAEVKATGQEIAIESDRQVAGVLPMLGYAAGKVWNITPHAAFEAPQTVQIPLPDELTPETALVLYYAAEAEEPAWYLGRNVENWMVAQPREVVGDDGVRYLELVITHGARVQIVENVLQGQQASVLPMGLWGAQPAWIATLLLAVALLAGVKFASRRMTS